MRYMIFRIFPGVYPNEYRISAGSVMRISYLYHDRFKTPPRGHEEYIHKKTAEYKSKKGVVG